jgi:hypothetical protein
VVQARIGRIHVFADGSVYRIGSSSNWIGYAIIVMAAEVAAMIALLKMC